MAAASNNDFNLICHNDGKGQYGSAITLSCYLSPDITAVAMEIGWFKETDCVCLYKNKQVTEGRGYKGRVSLFTQELQRGNVSLHLRDCRESDRGDYLCQVTSGDRTKELALEVSPIFLRKKRKRGKAKNPLTVIWQISRGWTEEERMKMEESVLMIELNEERFPGPVLKNITTLIEERSEWEDHVKKVETELEQTAQHTEEDEVNVMIRDVQERLVRERVEMRQREEQEMRGTMRAVVEALRNSAKPVEKLMERINQHEQQKHECEQNLSKERNDEMKRKLKRELEREDQQMKETEEELKRMQEERRQMVKNHRLEMRSREKSAAVEDKYWMSTLPALITHDLMTKMKKDYERYMNEKDREVETLKQKLSEMEKNKERQISETIETLERKYKLKQKDTELGHSKTLDEKNELVKEKQRLLGRQRKELQDQNSQLQSPDTDSSVPVRRRHSKELESSHMSGETPDSAGPLRRRNRIDKLPPVMGVESSSPDSPVPAPVPELRLVLLGRTGSGKIAVGNTILGGEMRNQAGTSTETQQSESRQGEVAGRKVTVVDTPDWFCPELSLEEVRQDVGLCIHLSAPGPHAFLLVLPVKQPAREKRELLEKMEDILGLRCWRNTMVLFTVTDEKNPEQLIQSRSQEVQTIVTKCGNRFHCLNIKESEDGSQVSELMEKIEKMVEGNRERFYSSEIYLEIESQIREMEKRVVNQRNKMKEREEQERKEKLERSVQETLLVFTKSINDCHAQKHQHEERISNLERKVKEEMDKNKKRELESEMEREFQKKKDILLELERLKEQTEKERSEMEERHRQEMEEITEKYEGEVRMEAERNLMKIILPELQQRIWTVMTQKEFDCKMEEKERELETLRHRERVREGIREGVIAGGEGHQDTEGLFSRLTQLVLWGTLSDPVINTQSDHQ